MPTFHPLTPYILEALKVARAQNPTRELQQVILKLEEAALWLSQLERMDAIKIQNEKKLRGEI